MEASLVQNHHITKGLCGALLSIPSHRIGQCNISPDCRGLKYQDKTLLQIIQIAKEIIHRIVENVKPFFDGADPPENVTVVVVRTWVYFSVISSPSKD